MQGWRWLRRWFQGVAACALASSAALAQQPGPDPIDGIYRGTLGKEKIVLEVGATASRAAGFSSSYFTARYFYRRYGVSIFLYGHSTSDGRILLREYRGAELTDNQLRLRFQGNKAAGVFCRSKDETQEPVKGELRITLTRVSRGFDPEWKSSDTPPDQGYYDLLLDFPLRTGPEMRVNNGMAYEVQSDPRFQIGMPRLTRFPDATVLAKVNEDLAGELKKDRLWISDCLSGDERGGSYEGKIKVTALTGVVFNVVIERWYYCGGAHPNYEMDTLTYDMKTGKRFRLYGLLYDEVRPEKPRKYAMYANPLLLV